MFLFTQYPNGQTFLNYGTYTFYRAGLIYRAEIGYLEAKADVEGFSPNTSTYTNIVVKNPKSTDIYVNDATVKLTVKHIGGIKDGENVGGINWPLTMDYTRDSDGEYALTTDPINQQLEGRLHEFVYQIEAGTLKRECAKIVKSERMLWC